MRFEHSSLGSSASLIAPLFIFSLSVIFLHYAFPSIVFSFFCEQYKAGFLQGDNDYYLSEEFSTTNRLKVPPGDVCLRDKETAQNVGSFIAICTLLVSIPGLIMVGFYGRIAVVAGKKTALVCPVLGVAILFGSIGLALTDSLRPYFKGIVATGSLLCGLLGSKNTFLMTIFTLVSDCTSIESRSFVFCVLESVISIAKIVGPVASGYSMNVLSDHHVVIVGMSLTVFCVLWIALMLPGPPVAASPSPTETKDQSPLSPSMRPVPGDCCDTMTHVLGADPFTTFREMLKLFGIPNQLGGNRLVAYVATTMLVLHLCGVGESSIHVIYLKTQLHWDAFAIGVFDCISSVLHITAMIFVPQLLVLCYGQDWTDFAWVVAGTWTRSIFYLVFGLCSTTTTAVLTLPLLCITGATYARIRSYISKQVRGNEAVEAFVAIAALEAIAEFFAPVVALIYALSVTSYSSLCFEVMSFACAIAAIVLTKIYLHNPSCRQHEYAVIALGDETVAVEIVANAQTTIDSAVSNEDNSSKYLNSIKASYQQFD